MRCWNKFRPGMLNYFMYVAYGRLLLESNETMVLSTINEINSFDTSTSSTTVSLVLAMLVILSLMTFLIYAWYLAFTFIKNYDPEKKFVLMEFFIDIKHNASARFHTPLMLLRRVVFVIVIIPLAVAGPNFIFPVLLVFELPYLFFVIKVRPFQEWNENFIEIMNECFYSAFIVLFWILNSEERWTRVTTRI